MVWFANSATRKHDALFHHRTDLLDRRSTQAAPSIAWPEWLSRWYEQQKASIKTTSVAPTANEVWAGWVKRNADRQKEPARPALLRQQAFQGGRAQWWLVSNLDGMPIPVMLLLADTGGKQKPGVVAVCSQGKARFLREHAGAVAQLLASGVDVCLVDVRGVGETATESVPSRTVQAHRMPLPHLCSARVSSNFVCWICWPL
jgi:hypothetical protein